MNTTSREFPFPTNITRRERLTFSKHAGMTIQQLGEIIESGDTSSISVEAETALLLIAAQRVDPSITFDDCLDHDDWKLAPPKAVTAPLESTPSTSSLPEPTASTS